MIFLGMVMLYVGGEAAVPVVPPELLNPQKIVMPEDYPERALRQGEAGIVSILLDISSGGRVLSCSITETSGSATLDAKTSSLFSTKARFAPATQAGVPVAGTYRTVTSWGVDQHQPRATLDLSLQVASLPPDYRGPVKTKLTVDQTGRVAACDFLASSGSGAADRAVCDQLRREFVLRPPKAGPSGGSPAAVRLVTVTLSTRIKNDRASR